MDQCGKFPPPPPSIPVFRSVPRNTETMTQRLPSLPGTRWSIVEHSINGSNQCDAFFRPFRRLLSRMSHINCRSMAVGASFDELESSVFMRWWRGKQRKWKMYWQIWLARSRMWWPWGMVWLFLLVRHLSSDGILAIFFSLPKPIWSGRKKAFVCFGRLVQFDVRSVDFPFRPDSSWWHKGNLWLKIYFAAKSAATIQSIGRDVCAE